MHLRNRALRLSYTPVVGDVCARGDVVEWKWQEDCHGTEVGIFVEEHPDAHAYQCREVWSRAVPANLAALCARDSLPLQEAVSVDEAYGPLAQTVGGGGARCVTDATCHPNNRIWEYIHQLSRICNVKQTIGI